MMVTTFPWEVMQSNFIVPPWVNDKLPEMPVRATGSSSSWRISKSCLIGVIEIVHPIFTMKQKASARASEALSIFEAKYSLRIIKIDWLWMREGFTKPTKLPLYLKASWMVKTPKQWMTWRSQRFPMPDTKDRFSMQLVTEVGNLEGI